MPEPFGNSWSIPERDYSEPEFPFLNVLNAEIEVDKDELTALREEVSRLADAVSSLMLELQLKSLGVTDIYHSGGCNELKSPKHLVRAAK